MIGGRDNRMVGSPCANRTPAPAGCSAPVCRNRQPLTRNRARAPPAPLTCALFGRPFRLEYGTGPGAPAQPNPAPPQFGYGTESRYDYRDYPWQPTNQ